ncbi:glycosyltransferase [Nocardioides sp. Y6]|uniref:Glycosyltransferase n=1 Tax=Nocardioides malaquae TaxID=2773426 RepID=A0ABR9RVV0_9ACTN|nr:glycosyltransferase [Nocardioides malaquae]MBE7325721.1 glycosyltransferase [Nocardioides malaquae]
MPEQKSAVLVPPRQRQSRPLTVASVPAGHVYVRHLAPLDGGGPRRLPDPVPAGGRPNGAAWWPPVMLDPTWLATADFDLLHLHFGFDACDPSTLEEVVEVLRRRGKPFVFTVHDLRNPHHEDRTLHDAQLDVLVPAADAVITLTRGAATEIARRWGVEATVVPHPHVVDLETSAALRRQRHDRDGAGPFRVGLHVKSLRAGMAPHRILPTLIETVANLDDAVLQVNGHRDVLERGGARFDDELHALLSEAAHRGLVDLRVHDYLSDADLWQYLASLDLAVLPYRFGTHSGWLEACRDVGTTVLAPTCGHFADQGPVLTYTHDEDHFDPASLRTAVLRAYEERPSWGASEAERRQQRHEVAAAHDAIYQDLVR